MEQTAEEMMTALASFEAKTVLASQAGYQGRPSKMMRMVVDELGADHPQISFEVRIGEALGVYSTLIRAVEAYCLERL